MPFKSRIFAFADCDDTLFQTERKCPPGAPLALAATDRDGRPLSFCTQEQQLLVAMLGHVTLIPVTGRSSPALARVVDPLFDSYRVVSHGALVLAADGRPDPQWLARHDGQWEAWGGRMAALCERVEAVIAAGSLPVRCRLIEDLGLPMYVSIKGEPTGLAAVLETIREQWPQDRLHLNGNNLALLPPYASKAAAVAFLMTRLRVACPQPPLFIGLGDSTSDIPFLKLCHYAMVPGCSQIVEDTWR